MTRIFMKLSLFVAMGYRRFSRQYRGQTPAAEEPRQRHASRWHATYEQTSNEHTTHEI